MPFKTSKRPYLMEINHERLLTLNAVIERVSISATEIYDRMKCGTFSVRLELGPRCVRWRESEIIAWIDSLPRAEQGKIVGKKHKLTAAAQTEAQKLVQAPQ